MTLGLPIERKRELRFGDLLILLPVSLSNLSVFFSPHSASLLNENNYYILSVYYRFHTQYFFCITFLTLAKTMWMQKRKSDVSLSPCTPNEERPCEERGGCLKFSKRALTRIWSCWHPHLGLSASRTGGNTFLLYKPPVYFIFLWQPELMNATTLSSEPLSSVSGYFLWPEQYEFFSP